MLQPKRTKYRKMHRGRRKGKAQVGNQVDFGDFGLKATSVAWVTARQIEAARRAITRHFRRGGQVWIRVFPDKPVTSKPAETRMGTRGRHGAGLRSRSGQLHVQHCAWPAARRSGYTTLERRRDRGATMVGQGLPPSPGLR